MAAEAESLAQETVLQTACRVLICRGPKVVLITLGAQGVLVTKKDTISYIPVIEVVVVVDTTGTGGAFSIGVIAVMLEGLDWKQAAHLGYAVAATNNCHSGRQSRLRDQIQVQAWLLNRKKEMR